MPSNPNLMPPLAEGESYVYATTDAVRCEWCGAEPGERCHLEPDRSDVVIFDRNFPDRRYKYHTIRIDPDSEPIGIQRVTPPGYVMAPVDLFPPSDDA